MCYDSDQMTVVPEYIDETGRNPFGGWFAALDSAAAVRVTVALERIAQGIVRP